jgi:acylphosphatase
VSQRLAARIHGRVQGVGFRYHAERQARGLGLTGWVRNRADGDVEILAEGPADALRQLLDWCRQGPPSAAVTRVEEQWSAATGEFAAFGIRA